MKTLRGTMLGIAVVQAVSTVIGFVQLLATPQIYAPVLAGSAFAGRYVLAAVLLGVVVGGFQWAAILVHLRRPRWLALGHALAGLVMIGWIAGECLVLNLFMWPHALWGGLGVAQLALALVLLGALRPQPHLTGRAAATPMPAAAPRPGR